jgi:RimJ/RimL family protein N-acetyltransferase
VGDGAAVGPGAGDPAGRDAAWASAATASVASSATAIQGARPTRPSVARARAGRYGPRWRPMTTDVTLTPTVAEDGPALRALHEAPEVVEWWDRPDPEFPFDEPQSTRFTIRAGGEIAGLIQFAEENEPKYRCASIDLFLGPGFHNRGIGTAAIEEVLAILLHERGHHRVTIDPAAHNHAAVRCYEKAGFRRVGVMRLAERDSDGAGWHDSLLMELVVEPPPPRDAGPDADAG